MTEKLKNELTDLILNHGISCVDMVHGVKVGDKIYTDGEFMDMVRECIKEIEDPNA